MFPVPVIEPPVAVQVTAVFALPLTVAISCAVPLGCRDKAVGVIEMLTTEEAEVTVIVALAVWVLSATLVAVTV